MRSARAVARRNGRCYPNPRPMDYDEPETNCEREHCPPPIFLESVTTENNKRTYTFAPNAATRFLIWVNLPLGDGEGPTISVDALGIFPHWISSAIDHVQRNEHAFIDAWYSSDTPRMERPRIGPETFGVQPL